MGAKFVSVVLVISGFKGPNFGRSLIGQFEFPANIEVRVVRGSEGL